MVASVPAAATNAGQRARREQTVAAAMELLQDQPYESIQVRDVSIRAGVALGTLYRYFPSKEQLFAQVLLDWSASFDESVLRRRTVADSDVDRLRLALRRSVRAFERYPNFFQLISVLEASKDPVVQERFTDFSGRFWATLVSTLVDIGADDATIVVEMAASFLGGQLRAWQRGQLPMRTVHARIDRAAHILVDGGAHA